MHSIKYTITSKRDLLGILDYYSVIDFKLCEKLEFELKKIENSIILTPDLYRIRYRDVRRVNFYNFPFCIFYRFSKIKKEIHIIRIIHQSSDPTFWP